MAHRQPVPHTLDDGITLLLVEALRQGAFVLPRHRLLGEYQHDVGPG